MPSFIHESLLWWGLPLIGVPILIHLINLTRHKRIRWAAMEFLLASQKRHRTSILFKQLLLLLLRMLAIAAIVFMVAQPLVRNQFSGFLGGSRTHHIVLVDDSFSMSDRWAETSAFEQAKQVVQRLGMQALHQDTPQVFTLVRFSKARQVAGASLPDMLAAPLDGQFQEKLEQVLGGMYVSQTAAEPQEALSAIERLPPKRDDEDRVVYLVSDFRANQWQEPEALRQSLQELNEAKSQIYLVNCVSEAHPNLAITALRAGKGTRASGVPLLVDVTVHNYSTAPARQVSVSLDEDGHARPAVVLEVVSPGKSMTRRFPVMFTTAGQHEIVARLQSDAVEADNSRSLVLDVANAVEVLVLDGDPRGNDARFLASALSPGGKVASGLKPLLETPRYLRDHPLDTFDAIYLLNIPRLDDAEIAALEGYVKAGGGVGFFMGEACRADFFNERLYRGGQGLFPLPLEKPNELPVDRLERAPDLDVSDHPIFSIFAGERNSFLNSVVITRYFAAPRDWTPPSDASTQVIARLRNRAPLAVEKQFGEGRVVAVLTKASPLETALGSWNNWARDPSFVVAMQEMQSYLSLGRHPDTARQVGTPLEIKLEVARYLPQVKFVVPGRNKTSVVSVDASATDAGHVATLSDTDYSGIYQAQLTRTDESPQTERFALNVVPEEGDLSRLDGPQLADRLKGVKYVYHEAADIRYDAEQLAGVNLSDSLLYALIIALVIEQLLAYSCSYHPASKAEARA